MILLFTNDLMAASKLSPIAAELGTTCAVSSNRAALLEHIQAGNVAVVLLDLNAIAAGLTELVATVKLLPDPPLVIAFGPHVHEAKLAAAQAAGCDAVYSRGQFYARTAEILRPLLTG